MALGYNNTRKALQDHVDEEDKGVTKHDTLGTGEVVHALGDLRNAAVGVVPYHHAGGEGDEHDSLLRGVNNEWWKMKSSSFLLFVLRDLGISLT